MCPHFVCAARSTQLDAVLGELSPTADSAADPNNTLRCPQGFAAVGYTGAASKSGIVYLDVRPLALLKASDIPLSQA